MTMNENSVGDIFQIYEVRGVPVAGAFDAPQRAGLPREAFEGPSVTARDCIHSEAGRNGCRECRLPSDSHFLPRQSTFCSWERR